MLADMTDHIPVARHAVPSLVHVSMLSAASLLTVNSNTIAGETSPTSGLEEYGFDDLITPRDSQMTSTKGNVSHADTTNGVLAAGVR